MGQGSFIIKKEKEVFSFSVRLTGLEPTRRETLDPKSSASTNFATGAKDGAKVIIFCQRQII